MKCVLTESQNISLLFDGPPLGLTLLNTMIILSCMMYNVGHLLRERDLRLDPEGQWLCPAVRGRGQCPELARCLAARPPLLLLVCGQPGQLGH